MYSSCTYCYAALGSNDVLEVFPVGSRLAFDSEKGRLWVICRACARWNLTPLEERWEAIDAAESVFARQKVVASTENISLARVGNRTSMVRIGRPLPAEVANWRYGDVFARRWRRSLLLGTALFGVVAVGGFVGLTAMLAAVPGAGVMVQVPTWIHSAYARRRAIARVPRGDGSTVLVRGGHMDSARLISREDGDWYLSVGYEGGNRTFDGMDAVQVLRPLMAFVNRRGARGRMLDEAMALVSPYASPLMALQGIAMANRVHPISGRATMQTLFEYSAASRIALEMVASEQVETMAAEGEVTYLERAWREAEEIAGIADKLLVSEQVEARFRRLSGRAVEP